MFLRSNNRCVNTKGAKLIRSQIELILEGCAPLLLLHLVGELVAFVITGENVGEMLCRGLCTRRSLRMDLGPPACWHNNSLLRNDTCSSRRSVNLGHRRTASFLCSDPCTLLEMI
jgi:hypothetical protein